jgi:sec-independent protein translocase protein TatA
MLGNAFGWPHLLILLAVILLLFGAAKLPALAKSVGQSARVFRGEMKQMKEENAPATDAAADSSAAPTTPSVSNSASDTASGPTEPKP